MMQMNEKCLEPPYLKNDQRKTYIQWKTAQVTVCCCLLFHLQLVWYRIRLLLAAVTAPVVIFALPFLACARMETRIHTLCGLSFKLTLLLSWWAGRQGTNHRPKDSAQAEAMWYVETVGRMAMLLIYTTSSSFIPQKTERERNWQLTTKSL